MAKCTHEGLHIATRRCRHPWPLAWGKPQYTAHEVAKVIVNRALAGDIDFVRVLLDRAEGGVMKQLTVQAKPVMDMEDDELKASLAELLRQPQLLANGEAGQ